MEYEILIKGSPMGSGNDDIHTGADVEDFAVALARYGALIQGKIRDAGFSPGQYGGAYAYITHGERVMSEGRIPVTVQSPLPEEDDKAWRREMAMEAGMAFGTAGYNDAMGYEVGPYEEEW